MKILEAGNCTPTCGGQIESEKMPYRRIQEAREKEKLFSRLPVLRRSEFFLAWGNIR